MTDLVNDLVACALLEGARPTSMTATMETKAAKQRLLDEIERLRSQLKDAEATDIDELIAEHARCWQAVGWAQASPLFDPGLQYHKQEALESSQALKSAFSNHPKSGGCP